MLFRNRKLRLEPLEDRRVLTSVVVTNNLDTVDGDTSSLAALELTPGDDGISIREAIEAANNTPGADEITFDFGHDGPEVILLTEGELEISDSLSITGDGANLLSLDASGSDPTPALDNGDGSRALRIGDGNPADIKRITITGVHVTGGDHPHLGGGIFTTEDLQLRQVWIEGNTAVRGGGIASSFGNPNFPARPIELEIVESTISGNYARTQSLRDPDGGYGGAIFSNGFLSTRLHQTTITGNIARSGALHVTGDITISRSVVYSQGADTFASSDGIWRGSSYLQPELSIEISNSIVSTFVAQLGGPLDVSYSLIGYSSDPWSDLDEAPVGMPDANGNLVGGIVHGPIDPQLGPLADHGGPTMTRALLPGSPALDAGDPSIAYDPMEYDQRGAPFARVANGGDGLRIDMGAYESQGVPDYPVGDYNHDGIANLADYVVWRNHLGSTMNLAADGSGNQVIDAADYTVWREHFGNTQIPLITVETPTEAAFALFLSPTDESDTGPPAATPSEGAAEARSDSALLLLRNPWRPSQRRADSNRLDSQQSESKDLERDAAAIDQSFEVLPILR
ncbi:hypothetical protein NG895_23150 [Aeoliella sp. ICT_H6.2]|uniref:Uncharacterized protein n=1 Tax=Aeoliella straminimaris TaxID=2954799 RepID=A0A9X2FI55_9BACT|nr:choice-of-anchor Q domain-containing protein [Aeoliella straminimaris]MCO6046806.1 hypothetical protein [Aeoliella straminimaris]